MADVKRATEWIRYRQLYQAISELEGVHRMLKRHSKDEETQDILLEVISYVKNEADLLKAKLDDEWILK